MSKELMPHSRLRSIIVLALSLGLIIAFVYYIYSNADKYKSLLQVSPLLVILSLMLTFISMFINGIISIYLLDGLGANLSIRDGFILTAASTLANQLPISGGFITKAFYLKRKHGLSYTRFLSASLALFFCFVAVNGLIGIMILVYWIVFKNLLISYVLFIGFVVMTACLLIFWFPLDKIPTPQRIRTRLDQALQGWMLIGKNPVLVVKLIALQTSLMLILAIRYWLAFYMLSQDINVGQAILFSSAAVLTQLVSVAPGGLGVTEAIVGGVASLLGFDMGVSVVAVGLDRLISTAVVFVFGGISTVALGKQISES